MAAGLRWSVRRTARQLLFRHRAYTQRPPCRVPPCPHTPPSPAHWQVLRALALLPEADVAALEALAVEVAQVGWREGRPAAFPAAVCCCCWAAVCSDRNSCSTHALPSPPSICVYCSAWPRRGRRSLRTCRVRGLGWAGLLWGLAGHRERERASRASAVLAAIANSRSPPVQCPPSLPSPADEFEDCLLGGVMRDPVRLPSGARPAVLPCLLRPRALSEVLPCL